MGVLFNPFDGKFCIGDKGSVTPRGVNAQTGATYTFVLGDKDDSVTLANASDIVLVLPKNSDVAFPIGTVLEYVAKGDTWVGLYPADGVVVGSLNGARVIKDKNGFGEIIKTATDTWSLHGDLSEGALYGYFAGGTSGAVVVTTADRIVFSTGVTSANTVSDLSQARYFLSSVSDGSSYGYFAGGNTGGVVATADRIVFSTGVTSANTVSNLSQARIALAGSSDGSIYGYFIGGYTGATVAMATADRIVFSTGATSVNTVSNLSVAKYYLSGLSDGSVYGYFAGGNTGGVGVVDTADRIVFSTGVTGANTVSNLSSSRYGLTGVSDGTTYGYFAGGGSATSLITTDRIVFSTGATSANTVSDLSQASRYLAGVSDGATYGYFVGGWTGGYLATAGRIIFSTGATSANTVSNLSQARYGLAGLSDFAI